MTQVLIDRELLDLCYQAVHALAGMKIEGFTGQRCAELRAILAQPTVQGDQQPVGETISNDGDIYWADRHPPMGTKLYAALAAQQSAKHPDDAAVDRFAAAMKSKLAKSREKGRHGWQAASAAHLSSLLYRHMYKADPLDVANLAMMLHQNGQAIELPHEARKPVAQQSTHVSVVPKELIERIVTALDKAAYYTFGEPVTPDSKVAHDLLVEMHTMLAAQPQASTGQEVKL